MATNWETTLRAWVKPPSNHEDKKRDRTELEIRQALANSNHLKNVRYKVYAKGSYANNTNVRLDYDVDIAVECIEFYYYDKEGAAADVRKSLALEGQIAPYKGGYTNDTFKSAVEDALVAYYGRTAVTRGNMAMRVREKKTTLPADVVPCFEYHYVYDTDIYGNPAYYQGTRVYRDRGGYIHNWPTQQKERGNAKNNATGHRYKRIVRALKRLENVLVAKDIVGNLPSFFIECLVYNVPNHHFNHSTYVEDMRSVLAVIHNATMAGGDCADWLVLQPDFCDRLGLVRHGW
ncbi:nucleotidyltransferase domain-containing protein, partial [Frankia canadensis]|uniref:nucleotidyltransferase domain-containing protein n=1 Tax=Frankia canadensis TaxID=1836972 RepID=UPI001056E15B